MIGLQACSAYQLADGFSPPQRSAFLGETPVRKAGATPRTDAFAEIARGLLAQLEPGRRIALQPYRPADVPVPLAQAQAFNDALARAIEAAPTPGVIVARDELPRLFDEAQEFGEAEGVKRLLEASRADVLLIGTITPARGGVALSYKAFDARNGRQLAAISPRFIPLDLEAPTGMPLAQALASAADELVRQAPDMRAVETLGVYYQQSDVQTAFGSYISRELVGRLVEKMSGLQASPAALLRPDLQNIGKLDAGGTENVMIRERPGAFLLSGTVWDFGGDVEVRLSLRGQGDRAASTSVRIRRDAIPGSLLPLAPADAQSVRRDEAMPFGLQLSTDRGRRPVYAVGDSAHLLVQSPRDGYLYCFHQASANAGGGVTQIFPNPYHRDARIAGQSSVHIPDASMNFALKVFGPAGVEFVRCYVADRDLADTLPAGIAHRGLQPIDVSSLDDLDRIFRTLPAFLSAGTLVMTIDAARPMQIGDARQFPAVTGP